MKRKLILFGSGVLIILLSWYLFVVPYEYLVRFQTNTLPGVVNQTVKLWNTTKPGASIVKQTSLSEFTQELKVEDRNYVYSWSVDLVNDSTTKVEVGVSQPGRSFINKMLIPFTKTRVEEDAERLLRDFHGKLNEHLRKFRVRVEGISELKGSYCVCVPLESDQFGKAGGMMANYSLLSSFISENEIKPNGMPLVEITRWDINRDEIEFNFCYPIVKQDSLPAHELMEYRELKGTKAIKAIYNGNYITSDRAWYALKNYARNQQLETVDLPVEVFYNNPNFDSNELDWKAEIFLPLR